VLGSTGDAEGTLYLDDGETFDYQTGAYIHRRFKFSGQEGKLVSEDLATKGPKSEKYLKSMKGVRVERVIVVGAPQAWSGKAKVKVTYEPGKTKNVKMSWHVGQDGKAPWAVVRDPNVKIGAEWSIDFSKA
jgi:alpha 1,3-glucosidase